MANCNHKVLYIHEQSVRVCHIVDNQVQSTEEVKTGYMVRCLNCCYLRTFRSKDKFPLWLKNRVANVVFESYTNKGL